MGSAGGSKSPNETVSIEVGARDDVASTFALASHVTYNKGYDVSKVGANKMSISGKGWAGGNSVFRLNSLAIAGGTAYIPSLPNEFITFRGNGGILQLGYATTSQEIVDVPAETDSETGEVITPAQTHTEYTYTPYDPSALIKNSTAAIGFDDQGTNCTWATALAESNTGGFIKDGTGTLTLSATPLYDGITWIKGGKIVFPEGTDVTLDPRSVGVAENARVDGYKYMANTVLYGNEPGSDVDMDVDASGITKVDISAETYVDALLQDKRVVLCSTTANITHLSTRYFVQGETLLVPEKPEGLPDKKWDWAVRIMMIGDKKCVCVGPRVEPFALKLR
jgi:autotransporter-associated beta strand protein